MKYRTIYADPPWPEYGAGKIKRGADRHYPLMKIPEIIALGSLVKEWIHPDGCHLYLWTTNNYLPDAIKVMERWGFKYITIITWFKDGRIGMGQYFRGVTEHCLFGRNGVLPYKSVGGKRCQGLTGFHAEKTYHSRKPDEMREMIELVSHGPFIEMFSRPPHPLGWDVWGNEVNTDDSDHDKDFPSDGKNTGKSGEPTLKIMPKINPTDGESQLDLGVFT